MNKEHRQTITKILSKFFYLKLCFNRIHGGYVGVFIDLFRDLTWISLGLKYFFPGINLLFVFPIFFVLLLVWIGLGHVDIQNHFAKLEQSINNRNTNPELMQIYENTGGKKE